MIALTPRLFFKRLNIKLLSFFIFSLVISQSYAATYYSVKSAGSFQMSTLSNWTTNSNGTGTNPILSDFTVLNTFIIQTSNAVTCDLGAFNCLDLTIEEGASLDMNDKSINSTGIIYLGGILNLKSSNHTIAKIESFGTAKSGILRISSGTWTGLKTVSGSFFTTPTCNILFENGGYIIPNRGYPSIRILSDGITVEGGVSFEIQGDIMVENGATFIVTPLLTIKSNTAVHHLGQVDGGTLKVDEFTVNQPVEIDDGLFFTINKTLSIGAGASFTNNSSNTILETSCIVNGSGLFTNNSRISIKCNTTPSQLPALTYNMLGTASIVIYETGSCAPINTAYRTLICRGSRTTSPNSNITANDLLLDNLGGSLLKLGDNSTLTINNKLTLSNTGGATLDFGGGNATVTINGELAGLTNSTIIHKAPIGFSQTLILKGATNTLGTFNNTSTGTSEVIYSGTVAQTMFDSPNYGTLTINNTAPSPNAYVKSLNGSSISVALKLTAGRLSTSTSAISILNNASIIKVAGWVETSGTGTLEKKTSSSITFLFPVGNATSAQSIELKLVVGSNTVRFGSPSSSLPSTNGVGSWYVTTASSIPNNTIKLINPIGFGLSAASSIAIKNTNWQSQLTTFLSTDYTTSALTTSSTPIEIALYSAPTNFVVTDLSNGTTTDGVSLRWAITQANASNAGSTITFDVGTSGGPFTINLTSPLPDITTTYGLLIDGFDNGVNPGTPNTIQLFNASSTTPLNTSYKIILKNNGFIQTGLTLKGKGTVVKGLVFENFGSSSTNINGIGILISGKFNSVFGCSIGMGANGTTPNSPNTKIGIQIDADSNYIGNGTPAGVNIIAGLNNSGEGIVISSIGNIIAGNCIGLQKDGRSFVNNNQLIGLELKSIAKKNTIGGPLLSDGNVFSGNTNSGILISGNNNSVENNRIGLSADGTSSITTFKQTYGINLQSDNNQIKNNVISGNDGSGIYIVSANASKNKIQGNTIGLDHSGKLFLNSSNQDYGILILNGAINNTIGGINNNERNILSGNAINGILLSTAEGSTIIGNIIGLQIDGQSLVSNSIQKTGVYILDSKKDTISTNLISGNIDFGVYISGSLASNSVIDKNYIGTDLSKNKITSNPQKKGISINNTIDNVITISNNVIAYNIQEGIYLSSTVTLVKDNNIYCNLSGITQLNSTTTIPTLSCTIVGTTATAIITNMEFSGKKDIYFYKNNLCNKDEGETFVGSAIGVANNSSSFSYQILSNVSLGDILTVRYTSGSGSSQFSLPITVTNAPVTWLGTTDSNWQNAANWSTGLQPTSSDDIIIPAITAPNFNPIISAASSITVNSLTIQASAILTVPTSATLSATSIVNSGKLCKGGTINSSTYSGSIAEVALTPSIQITNQDICNAAGVTFTTTSSNQGATPTYQWNINGSAISGQTNSTYTTTTIQTANKQYSVTLTSSEACVNSQTASAFVQYITPTLPTIIPDGSVGVPYSQIIQTNLTTPIWNIIPSVVGVTINSITGLLDLNTTTQTSYTFNLNVSNSNGCSLTQTYTVKINAAPPILTTWNGTSWSNGLPTSTSDVVINGNYSTSSQGALTGNNITINTGATLTIDGTQPVTVLGNLTNSGTINQSCNASLLVSGSTTGNLVVLIMPKLSPSNTNFILGRVGNVFNQQFSVSIPSTTPLYSITSGTLPSGLSFSSTGNLSGTPTSIDAQIVEITYTDNLCITKSNYSIIISDLPSPNMFVFPIQPKTYGDDDFFVTSYSVSTAPITYSISNQNACATIDATTGKVSILCAGPSPNNIVTVTATQVSNAIYSGDVATQTFVISPKKTSLQIKKNAFIAGVNDVIPYATNSTATLGFLQQTGTSVATVDANGNVIPTTTGTFTVQLKIPATANYTAFDSTFTFNVFVIPQAPVAIRDVVMVEMNQAIQFNVLKNDYGITDTIINSATDIDIRFNGLQINYYLTHLGNVSIDNLGNCIYNPFPGYIGTDSVGYTITDARGLTSEIAYISITVTPPAVQPPLQANEIMTPNNDDSNDALVIGNTDINQPNNLTVTDEVGNTVYSQSNYKNDWKGINKNGELLEQGIYYFVFKETTNQKRSLYNYFQIVR